MLRDVTHNITDGLLGFATSTGDGVHVKIGVSPVVSDKPIAITGDMSAATIKQRLGLSPLADAAMDSVQFGSNRIYCFPVKATTPGTAQTVTKKGTGFGGLTVSGDPTNRFSVVVKITARGGFNAASFAASIDGGNTFRDENTVPVAGEYDLAGTGLTLKFAEATQEEQKPSSFLVGDTFSFETTAPSMTNGDVLTAIEKLKNFSTEHEGVHIVGESTLALWQAVSEAQLELMNIYKKPMFFVMESPAPEPDENGELTDWALQMEADRKKIKNYNIQVAAAWGRLVRLDNTTQLVNLAGIVFGLYARASVQTSIGKTRTEAGFGIPRTKLLELAPAGMDNAIIELLDLAGFLTLREYDGLDDYFVYHTKMMSPDGSDYRYAEDVRVLNKIVRETRKEGLQLLNDDFDLEDVQGELETKAKFMFPPLQRMIDNGEISSAEIIVPEGQDQTIIEDEKMRVKVRYVSRGYIREVEVDLGRARPGE
ncbi:hypothetical protein SDC9_71673 [bioreactor metagenome]|uniref:Tail sheath protein subtilisin-like domain-containing protein n=1 Tax=bioreactor metagenome TaxID=1076179 RepID=A0A644YF77_9ZZZZ